MVCLLGIFSTATAQQFHQKKTFPTMWSSNEGGTPLQSNGQNDVPNPVVASIHTPDGGSLTVWTYKKPTLFNGYYRLILEKSDANGATMWSKDILGNVHFIPTDLCWGGDGYIIVGNVMEGFLNTAPFPSTGFVMKTDLNGTLVWTRAIETTAREIHTHGVARVNLNVSQPRIGVVGWEYDFFTGYRAFFVELDDNGNHLSGAHHTLLNNPVETAFTDITGAYDGTFYITGHGVTLPSSLDRGALLIKTKNDNSGDFAWAKFIQTTDTWYRPWDHFHPRSVSYSYSFTSGPGIVLAGMGDHSLNPTFRHFGVVCRLDMNGNVQWTKRIIGDSKTNPMVGVSTAWVTYVGGNLINGSGDSRSFITALDPVNGNHFWSREYYIDDVQQKNEAITSLMPWYVPFWGIPAGLYMSGVVEETWHEFSAIEARLQNAGSGSCHDATITPTVTSIGKVASPISFLSSTLNTTPPFWDYYNQGNLYLQTNACFGNKWDEQVEDPTPHSVEDLLDETGQLHVTLLPGGQTLEIALEGPVGVQLVRVMDMQGKVLTTQVVAKATHATVPVRNLAAGIYVVQVQLENGEWRAEKFRF